MTGQDNKIYWDSRESLIDILRAARDFAYAESDKCKANGEREAEALYFGTGVGIEKAAHIVLGTVI